MMLGSNFYENNVAHVKGNFQFILCDRFRVKLVVDRD